MASLDLAESTLEKQLHRNRVRNQFELAEERIPVVGFVTEDFDVLVLQNWDLVAFWETEGIDSSCLSEEQKLEHTDLLSGAFNEADLRLSLRQYYLKETDTWRPLHSDYRDPLVNAIDQARSRQLEGSTYHRTRLVYAFEWKTGIGSNSLGASVSGLVMLALKAISNPDARKIFQERLTQVFSGDKASTVQQARLLDAIGEFQAAMDGVVAKMERLNMGSDINQDAAAAVGATSLNFMPLKGFDAFYLLQRLWNWDPEVSEHAFLPTPTYLAHWIPRAPLDWRHPQTIYSGSRPLRVFTIRGFRDPLQVDVLRHIRHLPCEMLVHTRLERMNVEESSGFIAKRIRSAHNQGGFTKGDPLKTKRIEDMTCALKESVRGRPFAKWSGTIVLSGRNQEELRIACRRLEAAANRHGIVLTHEALTKDCAFFSVWPGNRLYEFHTRVLQTSSAMAVNLPYRASEGRGATPPKGCEFPEPLASLSYFSPETMMGFPVNVYLSVGNISHFAVLGKSGGGKSFLINFLVNNFGRYAGTRTAPCGLKRWLIDKGHSYKSLCQLQGGAYINIADPLSPSKLNPFDLRPEKIRSAVPDLVQLLGLMMAAGATTRAELTEQEASALGEALLQMGKEIEDTQRIGSLEMLAGGLMGHSALAKRLAPWLPGGEFGHIFPAEPDGFSNSDFVVFNFEEEHVPDNARGPVFMYILRRISAAVESEELAGTRKLCFIDEAAAFLTPRQGDWKSEFITQQLRTFVVTAWTTWRKKGGTFGLATQDPSQFTFDRIFWDAFRGAGVPTRIYLSLSASEALTNPRTGLGMPQHLVDEIKNLPQGAFLMDSGGMRRYLILQPDSTSYAIYTTSPSESAFRSKFLANCRFSEDYTPFQAFQAIGEIFAAAKRSPNAERFLAETQA